MYELQVGVAQAASRPERLAEVHLLAGAVALEHAALSATHPPSRDSPSAEQRRRAGQPPAHDRGVADDRAVHVGERPCNAHGAEQVAGVAVGGVRALPFLDGPRIVELEIGRAGQPLDHITGCWFGRCAFEDGPSRRCVAATQRGATFGDEFWDLCGHSRIIARAEAALPASLRLGQMVTMGQTARGCSPRRGAEIPRRRTPRHKPILGWSPRPNFGQWSEPVVLPQLGSFHWRPADRRAR